MCFFIIKKFKVLMKFNSFRYFLVGGAAAGINLFSYIFLLKVTDIHYLIAAVISFLIGTMVNYQLSIKFIFDSEARFSKKEEVTAIFCLSGFSLCINLVLLYIFVQISDSPILSRCCVMIISYFYNYLARKYLIFARKEKA